MLEKYNVEYKGVTCTGVDWEADPYRFQFEMCGKVYTYEQQGYISSSADTDHIKYVIRQFLESFKENSIQKYKQILEYLSDEIRDCESRLDMDDDDIMYRLAVESRMTALMEIRNLL